MNPITLGRGLTFPVWLQAVLRSLCSGGPLSALSSHQAHHTCHRIFILIRSRRSFPWTHCRNCAVTLYNHWVVQEYQKEDCGLLKRKHIFYIPKELSHSQIHRSTMIFFVGFCVFLCVWMPKVCDPSYKKKTCQREGLKFSDFEKYITVQG